MALPFILIILIPTPTGTRNIVIEDPNLNYLFPKAMKSLECPTSNPYAFVTRCPSAFNANMIPFWLEGRLRNG